MFLASWVLPGCLPGASWVLPGNLLDAYSVVTAQEYMSSCSTVRRVFLFSKKTWLAKTCLVVEQVSSRRHAFLLNEKTRLPVQKEVFSPNKKTWRRRHVLLIIRGQVLLYNKKTCPREDMSSCGTGEHVISPIWTPNG